MAQEPDPDRRHAFEQLHGGCTSDETAGMLERLVDRLTDENWDGPVVHTHVLKSVVPNAFVLAGGDVYVTQGLLDLTCTEDDLAAVLAHELGHLEDPAGFEVAGLTMTDRLEVEAEADRRAVMRLLDSGYDVTALLRMIDRLAEEQPPGWAEDRRARLEGLLGKPFEDDVPVVPGACDAAPHLEQEL